jgi:signal transduction histidine kinase
MHNGGASAMRTARRRHRAGATAAPPRGSARRLGLFATAALAATAAPALADAGATLADGGWTVVVALLLVAALAAVAGTLWSRQRGAPALFAARHDAQTWARLVDGCRWRTDASHRVREWAAGATVGVPAWAEAWRGHVLWDVLDTADGTDLRGALESGSPLVEAEVRPRGSGRDTTWTLRAVPQIDAQGRFAGHAGTLAPRAGAAAPAPRDDAALDALLETCPGPVWIADHDAALPGWRVRRSNAPALKLAGGLTTPTWPELVAALPPELQLLVGALKPDAAPVVQGRWCARLVAVGDGATAGRLLALWPAAGADDVSAAERESFTYAVSHDLRAPIRVVEGFTRILKEDYGAQLDRIGNDHLDRVLGAAARMNHMIDTLLALARLSSQPLVRQPVNLTQLAGYVVDELRRQYPTPPADVTIEPGMVVQGDPTLLRMALENLLGNAWKYSARCERRAIAFERTRADGRDAFVVRDNGAGFDMRFADRLFGVFQRLHSASDFPGTGIGLASVKRIVARHGGQIWAEGEVGKGARFYFTLGD